MPDTAVVRPGEEIPLDALARYIGEPVEVEQFPGGHSNLTYLVRTPSLEYVLRRAPLGPVPPKAHDMAREYSILKALSPLFPPAPRVYSLCEDTSVIGAVFYLMERRRGRILRNPAGTEGGAVSEAFVDCLSELHAIDIQATGLAAIGRPEGFLDRQVSGWTERWCKAETPDRPDARAAIEYLASSKPESPVPTVVHNDYKLDNVMFDEGLTRVAAVLDWEMTTVGDPLADLGLTLCYWTIGSAYDAPRGPGWYTREQLIDRYATLTGRDVRRIGWYETLGVFKLAVILQQIYVRWVQGHTADERFRDFGARVKMLVDRAVKMAESAA
jgi:aminoglycoside phosphotransferase (APT) family kinase protein